jgi:hypothetical protein
MATLSTRNLQIDELTGMPHDVMLTATVTVELNRIETALLDIKLLRLAMTSRS